MTSNIHRSSDHLVLVDRNVLTNPRLSYAAKGMYAYLESLDDKAFQEFVDDHEEHPLVLELVAEGVYKESE